MKKFLFITLAVVLITSLFLVAPDKPLAASSSASEEAKYGGRLILIGPTNVSNIGNPDELSGPTDAGYSFIATEGLLRLDAEGNLGPWLAEKYEIAPDGSSVTFFLRKGVKFHDGTPFNAKAVKVNVDIQINTKAWANMKSVKSCEVIDEHTVRLNFVDGKFDWVVMNSLAGFFSCMMFSPTALQTKDAKWLRSHPVGTGAFKLVEYKRDQYLKYDRFDEYWGGKAYLDGIDLRIIPDPTTSLLAFKSGEVHAVGILTKDAADMIKSGYEVRETSNFVFNMSLLPDSNNTESPFHDIRVRRALEHAIDKKALVEGLTDGYGTISNQPFIKGTNVYNPNVVGYPYNPEKAKALLAEAGYPNGFTTKVLMVDVMPLDMPIAVQDMVKQVGITLEFDRVSLPQFNFQVGVGWEGLAVGGCFTGSGSDPANSLRNGPLSNNTTWVSNNQPDEAYALSVEAATELDPDKRAAIYRKLSKMLTDDYAQQCWLFWVPFMSSLSPKVKGADFDHPMYEYNHAWLEK